MNIISYIIPMSCHKKRPRRHQLLVSQILSESFEIPWLAAHPYFTRAFPLSRYALSLKSLLSHFDVAKSVIILFRNMLIRTSFSVTSGFRFRRFCCVRAASLGRTAVESGSVSVLTRGFTPFFCGINVLLEEMKWKIVLRRREFTSACVVFGDFVYV